LYEECITPNVKVMDTEVYEFDNVNKELNIAAPKLKEAGLKFNGSYRMLERIREEIIGVINDLPDFVPERTVSPFVEKSNKENFKGQINSLLDELVEN
jgi:hypothetical protein